MTSPERRRQLVGLGLQALTERPIHEVSLDEIAAKAGISRSLLFHYFPTKTAFYEEVVAAAGRRVLRTVHPDSDTTGTAAVDQFLERWIAQIERRRDLYIALVQGNLADLGGQDVAGSLRERMADLVREALADEHGTADADLVHAWLAYVEDRALSWSSPASPHHPARPDVSQRVQHCRRALLALVALDVPNPRT